MSSQIIAAQSTSSLPEPLPVVTHTPHSSPVEATINPVDDFFGYTLSSSRTHDSRHDRRLSDVPPPYAEPPVYTLKDQPVTLAMYLFKFGFIFPLFWVMGALILVSPLRAPPPTPSYSWLPDKTESERQAVINKMRAEEVKWAWRCLFALLVLVIVAVVIAVSVWAVLKS